MEDFGKIVKTNGKLIEEAIKDIALYAMSGKTYLVQTHGDDMFARVQCCKMSIEQYHELTQNVWGEY